MYICKYQSLRYFILIYTRAYFFYCWIFFCSSYIYSTKYKKSTRNAVAGLYKLFSYFIFILFFFLFVLLFYSLIIFSVFLLYFFCLFVVIHCCCCFKFFGFFSIIIIINIVIIINIYMLYIRFFNFFFITSSYVCMLHICTCLIVNRMTQYDHFFFI